MPLQLLDLRPAGGCLYVIVPRDAFRLLQGEEVISTYTFGTGVARHTFDGAHFEDHVAEIRD